MSVVDAKDGIEDPEGPSPVVGPSKPRLLNILVPGLITGASDDDPSGIATYSQAGAQFGMALNWTMLFTFPLMVAVQIISARVGRTTGRGIAGILRQHYPNWLLLTIVALVLVANTIAIGADLGAMADGARLLFGGAAFIWVLAFAVLSAALQVFMQYTRYVAILKYLAFVLLAYVATLFMAHVDWGDVGGQLVLPKTGWSAEYLTTVVAVFGTTISPYLFFWQSSQEAEDVRAMPERKILLRAPEQGTSALERIGLDTFAGMAVSNLIALAIMITAGATLHASNITDLQTSAQAAEALRPIAGAASEWLFALGIVGTGLLAIPVLAGSAAYAVGEARRWPTGLGRRPAEAKAFYATVVVATLLGMLMNFSPLSPIQALYWSAVLNGIVAVLVMILMMIMVRSPKVMGEFATKGWLLGFGWAATAAMVVAVGLMLVTSWAG